MAKRASVGKADQIRKDELLAIKLSREIQRDLRKASSKRTKSCCPPAAACCPPLAEACPPTAKCCPPKAKKCAVKVAKVPKVKKSKPAKKA